MPLDPRDQKILNLEQQVKKLLDQIARMNRQISFLERENARRKQDVNQLANRKG
jgi:regulator of replication initiation timing